MSELWALGAVGALALAGASRGSRAWSLGMPGGRVLYRATSDGFSGTGSHWTPCQEDAEAYMLAGVGHGGDALICAKPSSKDVVLRLSSTRDLADAILYAMTEEEATLSLSVHEDGLPQALQGFYAFEVLEGEAAIGRQDPILSRVPLLLSKIADWVVFSEPKIGEGSLICETWRRLDDRHPLEDLKLCS